MPLSRADRIGATVLSFIALVALLVLCVFVFDKGPTPYEVSTEEQRAMSVFGERMRREDSVQRRKAFAAKEVDEPMVETFVFDPNTADYNTFLRLGLRPWQAKNALKYRAKGGRWRKADDFARLYGLTKADFLRLRPYIVIKEEVLAASLTGQKDTLRYARVPKLAEGQTIALNASDTTALKLIPGVGSYTATKIVRYRERLGGFVSKSQLNDIPDLSPDIHRWFHFDATDIRRIPINTATFKDLVRHPYLSYEQVKAIVTHIRHYGALRSWNDLRYNTLFKESDFQRLLPYFEF